MGNIVRWERWLVAVGGVYMMFVPLFTSDSSDDASIWVAGTLGVAIAALALGALYFDAGAGAEGVEALLGAALFVAPWVFDYSELSGAAGNAWAVGAAVVVAAAVGYTVERGKHAPPSGILQH